MSRINPKTENKIAVFVIVLALFALYFQRGILDRFSEWSHLRNDDRPVIAEMVADNENVKFRTAESLTYRSAGKRRELRAKDTILTGSGGSTVITFKSGLKVEVQPNSLFVLNEPPEGAREPELTFLRGNVRLLNQTGGIKISGKTSKPEDFRPAEKKQSATVAENPTDVPSLKVDVAMLNKTEATPPPVVVPKVVLEEKKEKPKPTATALPKVKRDKESLPDSYIASVIKSQRTFLNRCYAQHLRLNPEARGRIDTSMTIEPNGSISTARIVGSTIPDPTLQQCVISTLQRTHFKAFNGDPIIVSYPINFE